MNETNQPTAWEPAIAQLAQAYPYPPTPDIAAAVRSRTNAPAPAPQRSAAIRRAPSWAVGLAVALAILVLGVLAVPQTRAAVLTFIGRIGAIRLFVDESLPPVPTTAPALPTAQSSSGQRPTATPVALALLAAVPGEPVALADLNALSGFPVWLPPQSSEWGAPDSAMVHDIAGHTLITIIWDDPDRPGTPVLTLTQTDIPQLAYKMVGADQITDMTINGLDGMWITAPHQLQLPIDGGPTSTYLASNVLIWSDDRMTYRIEGDISQEDALRLAESLSPDNSP